MTDNKRNLLIQCLLSSYNSQFVSHQRTLISLSLHYAVLSYCMYVCMYAFQGAAVDQTDF